MSLSRASATRILPKFYARLQATGLKNLSGASGVAYRTFRAILASFVAPNPAPKDSLRLINGKTGSSQLKSTSWSRTVRQNR
jgi:hypothetical protein